MYEAIKSFDPICECTKGLLKYGTFMELKLQLDELCDHRLPIDEAGTSGRGAVMRPTNAMGLRNVFAVNTMCSLGEEQAKAKAAALMSSLMVSPRLMSNDTLTRTIHGVVGNAISNMKAVRL